MNLHPLFSEAAFKRRFIMPRDVYEMLCAAPICVSSDAVVEYVRFMESTGRKFIKPFVHAFLAALENDRLRLPSDELQRIGSQKRSLGFPD